MSVTHKFSASSTVDLLRLPDPRAWACCEIRDPCWEFCLFKERQKEVIIRNPNNPVGSWPSIYPRSPLDPKYPLFGSIYFYLRGSGTMSAVLGFNIGSLIRTDGGSLL